MNFRPKLRPHSESYFLPVIIGVPVSDSWRVDVYNLSATINTSSCPYTYGNMITLCVKVMCMVVATIRQLIAALYQPMLDQGVGCVEHVGLEA
jgi:hypothetical protein